MKRTLPTLFFLASLLTIPLACQRDQIQPQSELTEDPTGLPLPPATCRIVKTTFKMTMGEEDKWPEVETITLEGGQKVPVGKLYTSTYSYDEQGRIKTMATQFAVPGSENEERLDYQYSPTQLRQLFESKSKDGRLIIKNTKIAELTVHGRLSESFRLETEPTGNRYEYDADHHRVKEYRGGTGPTAGTLFEQNIYENGDLTRKLWFSMYATGDTMTRTYSYENRPNLPSLDSYQGRQSQHLPRRVLLSTKGNGFGDGPLYDTHYRYWYDRQGRVRRRLAVGYLRNQQYLIEEVIGTVNVTDYEYECP